MIIDTATENTHNDLYWSEYIISSLVEMMVAAVAAAAATTNNHAKVVQATIVIYLYVYLISFLLFRSPKFSI